MSARLGARGKPAHMLSSVLIWSSVLVGVGHPSRKRIGPACSAQSRRCCMFIVKRAFRVADLLKCNFTKKGSEMRVLKKILEHLNVEEILREEWRRSHL
jgi:hypothetical protein